MLKRITCEKFKNQPLPFNQGLNVVLGDSNAASAIGKSTFLLLIDFAFGGSLYIDAATDIIKHIGHHQINFEFEFGGVSHYFYRKTDKDNKSVIFRCKKDYCESISKLRIGQFHEWLVSEYHIKQKYFTEIIRHATRVYGQKYHNEHIPLEYGREGQEKAVESLIKLLGFYEALEEYKNALEEYDLKPTSKVGKSHSDISSEIGDLHEQIEWLDKRRNELAQENEAASFHAMKIDENVYIEVEQLRGKLERLLKFKLQLESRLRAIKSNVPNLEGIPHRDFSALSLFFPKMELKALDDVENFHIKIYKFLESDINEEISLLEPLIEQTTAEIAELTARIKDFAVIHKHSEKILNEYGLATKEIGKLDEHIKQLETEAELLKKREKIEKELAKLKIAHDKAIAETERIINIEMVNYNNEITDFLRPEPKIEIDKVKKSYKFGTNDDKSEGNTFKNMVVYDLSLARLAHFPFLVHDSSIQERMETLDFLRLLKIYNTMSNHNCQVFIAVDKIDNYSSSIREILETAAVLYLSIGNELFGKSWTRKTKEVY